MNELKGKSNYCAYLLRCWRESDQWRYSLELVGNGRRHGFASVKELTAYLCELEENSSSDSSNYQEDTYENRE